MTDYEKDLDKLLKDPEFAAGYLTAAIDEDDRDALLLAIRRVAQAMGGMTAVAERAHIKRENPLPHPVQKGNPGTAHLPQHHPWARAQTRHCSRPGAGPTITAGRN